MAVTRIKNNQITDASGANTQLGVNAAVKLQNYSVTAGKLANSLVYGSDLTVSGNLTVNGTTTTVDTINTLIKDPILTLADGQTAGTPTVDIGLLGLRGANNSSFIGWQETGQTFMAILSNTTASNTTVNVSSYANFTASTITAQGDLSVIGNIIGSANFTGNVTAGNLLTPGLVSATGNATAGNVLTGGLISATGNATAGNVSTAGLITATGNVTGGNLLTGGLLSATGTITATANISGGNILTGGLISATGDATAGNVLTSGQVSATANVTGGNINTAGLASVTGNVIGGNFSTVGLITATGNVTSGNVLTGGLISATGNATAGNVLTSGLISATGNATAGNLLTSGLISSTGNATAGNILTSGLISAAGNITSATNVNTPNVVGASGLELSTGGNANINLTPAGTGNIIVNSRYINGVAQPVQSNDVATKIYVDNMVSTQIAYHAAVQAATISNLATATGGTISYTQPNGAGNGVGALLTTTGSFNLIDTSNVQTIGTRILVKNEGNAVFNGVYTWANATNIIRSTDTDQYGPNSAEELSINDYFFVQSGNVNAGSAWIVDSPAGEITFGTSNIAFAQFSSSQTYTGGNGISLYGTVISTVYDNSTIGINGSNQLYIPANAPLVTPNIGAATGTSLSVTGDVTANTNISAVGNVIGGNVLTGGLVSATGNITTAGALNGANLSLSGNVLSALNVTGNIAGGNILSVALISAGGNINTSANINQTGAGNINGNNAYFTGNMTVVGTFTSTSNIVANTSGIFYGDTVTGNGAIYGGVPGFTPLGSNVVIQFAGNANSYSQVNFQNINDGTEASTDYIATANNGDDTNFFINMGIGSNNYSSVDYPAYDANDGYLLTNGGNLLINAVTPNKVVKFLVGGADAGQVIATLSNTQLSMTGTISATGNITGPNIIGTTSGKFGNIVISGDDITDTNGRVNFNTAGADVDFAVNGDTVANIFYVDAGTGTASFGSATQTTNAVVSFNATSSILLPVGNTSVRPSTGVTGMMRFNTTANGLEIYDNSEWTPVGTTTFTVIADEQFNGDGSTVAFTLASSQTTNSCIVSINGVVQIPTSSYSVSTTTLTFTEAPAAGDLIDVREITTTTTVTAISNNSGNATVTGNATAAQIDVLGNLVVAGNVDAGSNYILGNGSLLTGVITSVSNVNNGTSSVSIPTTNGNILVDVTGINTLAFTTAGIENRQANGVGNIGNATSYFNTVFAKATSAQYADLAEKYVADAEYAPGTVVSFGGDKEVTQSAVDADRAVAGVVSTNPSYIMNATLEAEHVAVVAFTGRVPTSVTGAVAKGDLMVSNGDGTARAEADPKAGAIIGKALENFDGATGTIEVVIGRF